MFKGFRSQYPELCVVGGFGCKWLCFFVLATVFVFTSHVNGQDPILDSIEAKRTLERLESDADYRREMSRSDVFLYDVEKGTERRLTNSAGEEESPDLSENGKLLVYSSNWSVFVKDLSSGEVVQCLEDMKCFRPRWVPGKEKLTVLRMGRLSDSNVSGSGSLRYELLLVKPDGTGQEILQGSDEFSVYAYAWHSSEMQIAFIRERASDKIWELCLLAYGEKSAPRVLHTFEKGWHPSFVDWMPGGERLAVLNSGEKLYPTMFGINIRTGDYEELYRAGMSGDEFALSSESGRIALSEGAVQFDPQYDADPRMPELVKVPGQGVRWYQGDRFILYAAHRLPEGMIEKLKQGIPPSDDRMYLLMDGGGVGYFTDPDDEYALYVKEEKRQRNGRETTIWVDLSMEEAQAYVDAHDPGVILGPNGPDLEKGKRPKIEMAPGRPVYD